MFWVSLLEFIGLGALWTCLIWVVLFCCSRKFFFITSLIIFSSLFPPTSQEFLIVGIMDILDEFYNFIFYFSSLFFSTFWKSSFITLYSHPFMLFFSFGYHILNFQTPSWSLFLFQSFLFLFYKYSPQISVEVLKFSSAPCKILFPPGFYFLSIWGFPKILGDSWLLKYLQLKPVFIYPWDSLQSLTGITEFLQGKEPQYPPRRMNWGEELMYTCWWEPFHQGCSFSPMPHLSLWKYLASLGGVPRSMTSIFLVILSSSA